MNESWWRRNRLWLALLVPLLLAAIAASSFRLVTLYLPWEWSHPIVAGANSGTLTQRYTELDGVKRDREVSVRVLSVRPIEEAGGAKAVSGATLWQATLGFKAAPDQFLSGCEVELVDAEGNRYGFRSGLEAASEDGWYMPPVLIACVPEDAPGPTIDALTGDLVPSPIERPGTWFQEVLIAMPEDIEPVQLRIGWHQPEYLVLDVP